MSEQTLKQQVDAIPDARPQILRDRLAEVSNCLRAIEEKGMKIWGMHAEWEDQSKLAADIVELAREGQDRLPKFTGGTL